MECSGAISCQLSRIADAIGVDWPDLISAIGSIVVGLAALGVAVWATLVARESHKLAKRAIDYEESRDKNAYIDRVDAAVAILVSEMNLNAAQMREFVAGRSTKEPKFPPVFAAYTQLRIVAREGDGEVVEQLGEFLDKSRDRGVAARNPDFAKAAGVLVSWRIGELESSEAIEKLG